MKFKWGGDWWYFVGRWKCKIFLFQGVIQCRWFGDLLTQSRCASRYIIAYSMLNGNIKYELCARGGRTKCECYKSWTFLASTWVHNSPKSDFLLIDFYHSIVVLTRADNLLWNGFIFITGFSLGPFVSRIIPHRSNLGYFSPCTVDNFYISPPYL